MCGISGIFNFDKHLKVNEDILKKMSDCIKHRGPDGEGYFISSNIGIAHQRLSIIDLISGDQPIYNEDGSVLVVFNGEIYNYKEIKYELIKKGHQFKTTSDTEVIVHAYEEWGKDCQLKFIGMWAFALWDENQKKLFISRDRIGEKPLYYGVKNNSFVFASEIKSLLQYGFSKDIFHDILEIYLFLGYVPAPYTFYKNIYKLKPGFCITIDTSGYNINKYWDVPDIDEKNMITDEALVYAEFERLFNDAINIQLRSDVPYGVFLSGGLDSNSIIASVSNIQKSPVNTITIGFDEKNFDERRLASISAKAYGTNHHEFVLKIDSFQNLIESILFHFDEPFADPAAIPVFYMCNLARQKFKMAIAGDGGDEALSGYNTYQSEKFSSIYQKLPSIIKKGIYSSFDLIDKTITGEKKYFINKIKRILLTSDMNFKDRLTKKFDNVDILKIKGLITQKNAISIEDYLNDTMKNCPFNDSFYQLMWFQYKIMLPERMLPKVDRMSMANSMEVRTPFLDYRILEFMYKVHKNIKMKGFKRKSVLINTIAKKLPKALLKAKKRGFEVPLSKWFKNDHYATLLKEIKNSDFGLNSKIISSIIDENKDGFYDYGNFIWKLILYYRWVKGG